LKKSKLFVERWKLHCNYLCAEKVEELRDGNVAGFEAVVNEYQRQLRSRQLQKIDSSRPTKICALLSHWSQSTSDSASLL